MWQDMAQQDAWHARSQSAFGLHEIAAGQGAGFRIDDARHLHPVHHRNDQGDDPQARAEQCSQQDGEQLGRKRHHQVGEAHQRRTKPPPKNPATMPMNDPIITEAPFADDADDQ